VPRAKPPRILVTTAAALGHFHPLAAVASALQARGAEVRFASSPSFCQQIALAGFDACPCGMDWQSRDLGETWPDFRSVPRNERNTWINEVMWAQRLPEAMIPDLVIAVDHWNPSLILSGRAELAGPTVGEHAGIPYASTSAGRVIGLREFIASTSKGREALRRGLGLGPDADGHALYRHLYLNFIPEMFIPDDGFSLSTRRDVRPPAFEDPTGRAPDWLLRLEPGSVIYVTLGSILGEVWTDVFRIAIDAVADLGYSVIVTVGHRGNPDALSSPHRGVHVERYIPQRFVLERAALVICHGGVNTLLGALSRAVPVLVVPTEQSDQRWNAERCVQRGLGLAVNIEDADPRRIRQSAQTILAESRFRRAAATYREELLRLPAVDHAVDRLLSLAGDEGSEANERPVAPGC
jgi:UDP:flavonoid glycosyltransferase YjiC (YdhE family)